MQGFIDNVVSRFGYFGVGFLIALENIFPPIPSEVILTFSGYLCAAEGLNLVIMVVAATLGSVVGALVLYGLGRWIGLDRLRAFVDKRGKWLGLRAESLDKANANFEKRRVWSVLLFRLVPLMRSLISVPAGVNKMNAVSFVLLTALGSLVWNAVLIVLGAFLGDNREVVLHYFNLYQYLVYAVLGLVAVVFIAVKARGLVLAHRNKAKGRHG